VSTRRRGRSAAVWREQATRFSLARDDRPRPWQDVDITPSKKRTGLIACIFIAACGPGLGAETTVEPATSTGDADGSGSAATDTAEAPDETTTVTEPTGDTPTGDGPTGEPGDCSELAIADPGLLAAVREALDTPEGPISGEAALSIISLTPMQPVQSLSGIECLLGLQRLMFYETTVTDLEPLAALSELRDLDVGSSGVVDLGPLVGLPLRSLRLVDAPLADLGPIAQLPQLEYLHLWDTQVEDLTPLTGHPSLLAFGLKGSHPQSLAPIASIPTLLSLQLEGCGLTSVAALSVLPALETLAIADNQLTDLSGLAGMSALNLLWASNNQIGDLTALAGLKGLEGAELDHNQIVDLGPLSGATGLTRLTLSANGISDLTPLAGATKLNILIVDDNPLTGLQGLESLDLGMLKAANTGLKELPVLAPQVLNHLDLTNNHITDVTAIAGHVALDEVLLANNKIVDLGPIAQAPWLLAGCAVLDVLANPLDATTAATTLPAMCEHDLKATWDQGSCAPDEGICDLPI
jgi:Leucine-rich repeat (LRR) protein